MIQVSSDEESEMGELDIWVSDEEAWLLDDLLSAPGWDREMLKWLDDDSIRPLRDQIGQVLLGQREKLNLDEDQADMLRKLVPSRWEPGGTSIARELKLKLHSALLAPRSTGARWGRPHVN